MKTIDLSALRVVSAKDVEAAVREGASELSLGPRAVVTPSARDAMRRHGCTVRGDGKAAAAPGAASVVASAAHARLFASPEAEAAARSAAGRASGGRRGRQQGTSPSASARTPSQRADAREQGRPPKTFARRPDGTSSPGRGPDERDLMHLEIRRCPRRRRCSTAIPHATPRDHGRVPPACVIPEYDPAASPRPLRDPGRSFADAVLPSCASTTPSSPRTTARAGPTPGPRRGTRSSTPAVDACAAAWGP
jgi:hypothetical protein